MRPQLAEAKACEEFEKHTVFVVVSHVEIALHSRLEHGVAAVGHHVRLPDPFHAGVDGELKMDDDVVHVQMVTRELNAGSSAASST